MNAPTISNTARGEATITIAGAPHLLRFGMNVMRDVTKLTGLGTSEFAALLSTDFNEAATALVACAVKRYVPGCETFSQDDAGELIDGLSPAENDELADALKETLSVGPLMGALLAKVAPQSGPSTSALPTNGTSTLTLPSAS